MIGGIFLIVGGTFVVIGVVFAVLNALHKHQDETRARDLERFGTHRPRAIPPRPPASSYEHREFHR